MGLVNIAQLLYWTVLNITYGIKKSLPISFWKSLLLYITNFSFELKGLLHDKAGHYQ